MVFHWSTLTLAATGITGLALLLLLVPPRWVAIGLYPYPEGTFITVSAALGLSVLYLRMLALVSRKDFKARELHD